MATTNKILGVVIPYLNENITKIILSIKTVKDTNVTGNIKARHLFKLESIMQAVKDIVELYTFSKNGGSYITKYNIQNLKSILGSARSCAEPMLTIGSKPQVDEDEKYCCDQNTTVENCPSVKNEKVNQIYKDPYNLIISLENSIESLAILCPETTQF